METSSRAGLDMLVPALWWRVIPAPMCDTKAETSLFVAGAAAAVLAWLAVMWEVAFRFFTEDLPEEFAEERRARAARLREERKAMLRRELEELELTAE